ncbi:hypothetical protein [Patiriisocius sp. Uisw_017]|jgi:hypothetical protein|uniref:hypothetical protein n=1 Tax=Patiriisocius sp. Uisw_017 TaxID=3230968 RepID=UPI0039EAB6EF
MSNKQNILKINIVLRLLAIFLWNFNSSEEIIHTKTATNNEFKKETLPIENQQSKYLIYSQI